MYGSYNPYQQQSQGGQYSDYYRAPQGQRQQLPYQQPRKPMRNPFGASGFGYGGGMGMSGGMKGAGGMGASQLPYGNSMMGGMPGLMQRGSADLPYGNTMMNGMQYGNLIPGQPKKRRGMQYPWAQQQDYSNSYTSMPYQLL